MDLSFDIILNLIIATTLGALVGIERSKDNALKNFNSNLEFHGLRTYSLVSLLGYISGILYDKIGIGIALIAFSLIGLFALISNTLQIRKYQYYGITSELSSILTFLIGLISYFSVSIAIIITVIITSVLLLKKQIHTFSETISHEEILATIKFIIIAFILLPLLPQVPIDPWGLIIPYKVWLMVIFVSGITFLGYILSKIVGQDRGIEITGFIGGLAGSTATTISMANNSTKSNAVRPLAFATIAASSIMFLRVSVIALFINRQLFQGIIIPITLTIIVCGVLLFILSRNKISVNSNNEDIKLESPFQLKPALIFGSLYILILLISHFMNHFFGDKGVLIASAISGLSDIDPITLSISSLFNNGEINIKLASFAIMIATISNTIVKLFIARSFGSKEYSKITTKCFLVIILGAILSTTYLLF